MESIKNALNMLKTGTTGSENIGNNTRLVVLPNAIVFRFFQDGYHDGKVEQEVLAARVGDSIIGNSSALRRLVSHRTAGRRGSRNVVILEQIKLSELVPMIPFSVLKEARLNLSSYVEVDKGPAEILLRKFSEFRITENQLESLKRDSEIVHLVSAPISPDVNFPDVKRFNVSYFRKQHFAGARLFQCSGTTDAETETPTKKTFLLDVDRREIEHGIINPFLVELMFNASTISEAYDGLKPDEVKTATSFERQGEWFFLPCDEFTAKRVQELADRAIQHAMSIDDGRRIVGRGFESVLRGVLRAGRNRPNNVDTLIELDGKFYVKGTISHSGREHADLELESWHRALPNTATVSWTITGDVD